MKGSISLDPVAIIMIGSIVIIWIAVRNSQSQGFIMRFTRVMWSGLKDLRAPTDRPKERIRNDTENDKRTSSNEL